MSASSVFVVAMGSKRWTFGRKGTATAFAKELANPASETSAKPGPGEGIYVWKVSRGEQMMILSIDPPQA